MRVLHGRDNRRCLGASTVHMAQVERQLLEIIRSEFVLVVQDAIMCTTTGALQTSMALKIYYHIALLLRRDVSKSFLVHAIRQLYKNQTLITYKSQTR